MRRIGLALLFVLGLGAAGGLSAGVVAASGTTTTALPLTIAPGVTIGGVDVGDLTSADALAKVNTSFSEPLVLIAPRSRLVVTPKRLGAIAQVRPAVARALTAAAGTAIKLRVKLNRARTASYLAVVARRFDRTPKDAELALKHLRPWVSNDRAGRVLRRERAMAAIFTAIAANERHPLRLEFRELQPAVTRSSIGPVIVIYRGSNRLYLYEGALFQRVF